MVWQRILASLTGETRKSTRANKKRNGGRKHRNRRLLLESLTKRELLASDFGAITGTVFHDVNGNGTMEAGEPGLSGVTVSLSGPSTGTTTTDGSGDYRFDNLAAGSYTVNQVPPPPAGFTPRPGESPRTVVVSAAVAAGTPILTIDDFTGVSQSVTASSAGTNPNFSSVTDAGGSIIGTTRDIHVNVTSPTGSASVNANPASNPGFLELDPSATGAAEYTITWDGDTDATVLDPTGLGGVDLTVGGSGTAVQAVLGFDIDPASGQNPIFSVTIYTDATNFTTYAFPLPDTSGAPTA
ncbi:MAG: hypothetical protein HKN47_23750, partial [Pirellulaceae bacterium]|nr:hypothetical protein [Pirellulaceae bacterium]